MGWFIILSQENMNKQIMKASKVQIQNHPTKPAQHRVQWTGGYVPHFQAFFVALSFLRFDSESCPTHLPLTRAVGWQFPTA
jgi:hypothetical protein